MKLFTNDREAVFVRRPNRFLIIAADAVDGKEISCHCPNPGRLIEFFGLRPYHIPGIKLILEKRAVDKSTKKTKTAWTAAGLYYRDAVVPLFSARANKAAGELILGEIIKDLETVQSEYTIGDSRFDFLCVDKKGARHLVEVKACSLVEEGAAMFPDAPSVRALKHLEELAVLSKEGYICHVLFVIVHGKPKSFIPSLHTDPAFAAALSRVGKKDVKIHAALLRCNAQGDTVLAAKNIPVDHSHGKLAASNSGSYLILLELTEAKNISVGALGIISFAKGWYVYAGSAKKNLEQRISRHLRKTRKEKHWHIDYLAAEAKTIKALPIYSYRNLECDLAAALP
ncbi:hypothetical protein FACS1894147_08760 [Spirochaetia bacterium]|nr:hypothetical protein FACS1894147_08760 [Spirochaetia bacterium]